MTSDLRWDGISPKWDDSKDHPDIRLHYLKGRFATPYSTCCL